ncbi:MAG: D-alanine--D-alanine ligase [Candidatus Omnitrophota bacterium]|nr:D-alanine--D-alanine ligase [Candidatus Omnitrophota bacterium]
MQNFNFNGIKVGVLGGGISSEREISLISAQQAFNSLKNSNIAAIFCDITTSQKDKVKELIISYDIDVAFIALHGEFGEDGKIQEILEELNIPYTGSDPRASYLAMNKIFSKKIFTRESIPTANFIAWEKGKDFPKNIKYPAVVKPYFAGSSLGVSVVWQLKELPKALDEAMLLQDKVVVEDYIDGRELTVGILEEMPLAVVEIVPKAGYFDFTAKYSDGMAAFVAPAQLESRIYKNIQQIALQAHKALGCRDFSRVDLRLDKNNDIFVLEVNSIPGLTAHSLLPLSARACGISFDELILKMTRLALNEHQQIKELKKS